MAKLTPYGLLFNSQLTEIPNLYLANLQNGTSSPVTNETTGVLNGDIDPITGHLYYNRFTGNGLKLVSLSQENWKKIQLLNPSDFHQNNLNFYHDSGVKEVELNSKTTNLIQKPQSYSSTSYLIPRYWYPYLYQVNNGWLLQGITKGSDPLGKQSYDATIGWNTDLEKPYFNVQYFNRHLPQTIGVSYLDSYQDVIGTSYLLHDISYSAQASFFIRSLPNNYQGGLGWIHRNRSSNTTLIESKTRSGPLVNFKYTNLTMGGKQISPENGHSYALTYFRYPETTSDIGYDQFVFSGIKYISFFLPPRHVLMGRIKTLTTGSSKISPYDGASTSGAPYKTNLATESFLLRGYPDGQFIGRNLTTLNLEYRFPLSYSYLGIGTFPFSVHRWHAALFFDSLKIDGTHYNFDVQQRQFSDPNKLYSGTGIEFKANATIGYHLPLSLFFGLYYGLDLSAGGGLDFFIGMQM